MKFSEESLKAMGFPLKAKSSEATGTVWIENQDGVMLFEGNPLIITENFELMVDVSETLCRKASIKVGPAGSEYAAKSTPTLTATRSDKEPHRLNRLNRTLWYAVGRISGIYNENIFLESLVSLHDHKGQLEVVWSKNTPDADFPAFERAIDSAWSSINAGDGAPITEHSIAD